MRAPAESLIETIVAVTILVIGIVAASSLLNSAITGNQFVAQKEVAIQLGLEGLDALKNVRDTNYLQFSANAEECWNKLEVSSGDQCADASGKDHVLTEGQDYYVSRDFNEADVLNWHVLPVEVGANGYLDLYSGTLDDGRDFEMYAQTGAPLDLPVKDSHAFYRTLSVKYQSGGDAYDATVSVSWDEHGNTHSISLTRTIANVY